VRPEHCGTPRTVRHAKTCAHPHEQAALPKRKFSPTCTRLRHVYSQPPFHNFQVPVVLAHTRSPVSPCSLQTRLACTHTPQPALTRSPVSPCALHTRLACTHTPQPAHTRSPVSPCALQSQLCTLHSQPMHALLRWLPHTPLPYPAFVPHTAALVTDIL